MLLWPCEVEGGIVMFANTPRAAATVYRSTNTPMEGRGS